MTELIRKPVSLIVSGGRTGTEFLGVHMSDFYDSCASFHEPDCLHQRHLPRDISFVHRHFGFREGLLKKVFGSSGIRNISDQYVCGRLSGKDAVAAVLRNRKAFYEGRAQSFVIESNYAYFGLLPLVNCIFEHYTVTAIIRHPLTWIRSYLRKSDRYGPFDLLDWLRMRINARKVPGDAEASNWPVMNTAERLAWFYNLVYVGVMEEAERNPRIRIWRFEDLFEQPDRYDTLREIARHAGRFDHHSFEPTITEGALERRVNRSPPRTIGFSDELILEAIGRYCAAPARAFGYV